MDKPTTAGVYTTLLDFAKEHEFEATNDDFFTPQLWQARDEEYGTDSLLIVVHDGGEWAPYFNHDYGAWERMKDLQDYLLARGLYAEQCTGWYSAIYPV